MDIATPVVWGGGRGGKEFSTPIPTGPGSHPVSYTSVLFLCAGAQRPGRDVNTDPNLARRLKKE